MQGSRLTAWEMVREGIPHRLIADVAAAAVMRRGEVDLVITGADRIAANGDTANKIGTYALAILARHHGIPFWVAAPASTVDLAVPSGARIAIEERPADELRQVGGRPTAPAQTPVHNPAFDVTPAELIDAIVTERGVFAARTRSPPEVALGPSASSDQERARWLSGVGRLPVRPPVDRVGSACIAYGGRSILEAWRPPCSGSP